MQEHNPLLLFLQNAEINIHSLGEVHEIKA
jgi:hypothetical protein